MRITRVRVAVQTASFLVFLFFVWATQFRYLKGFPTSLYLEADPLVALSTALSTGVVYRGLTAALVLLALTLLIGRGFCNWLCPLGALQQFVGFTFNRRTARQRIESNRYRRWFAVKYCVLAFMLAAALFGSLQIGLLDPASTMYRAFATVVLPVAALFGAPVYVDPHQHAGAWLIGGLFLLIVGLAVVVPRFYCRALCPLGALLGWLSRWSLWRIERNPDKCVDCDLCLRACEGAADPHSALRKAECYACFNCLDDCPYDALSFKLLPAPAHEVREADAGRRAALVAGAAGVLFYGLGRASGDVDRNFRPEVVRPPGSVPEPEFLERCVKCDQCIRVCPTNVLQPALFEAGIEGLWTPILNMRMGYCELNCTLCGQVCPTGAIQKIGLDQKHGQGEFTEAGPVVLGTAFYNRGRCLPWAMDTPCVVCEEVCPVSPKAIYTRDETITDRHGQPVTLHRPYVDPNLCIGCGICEHECPVVDQPAIYVTAVGESRSKERSLLLGEG